MHISQFPLSFIPLVPFLFFLSSLQLLTATAHHSMDYICVRRIIFYVCGKASPFRLKIGDQTQHLYMDKAMHACKAGLTNTKQAYPFLSCSIVFACYIQSLTVLLTCSYHTAQASLEVQARVMLTHYNHGHPLSPL